jgi:hypothetical protein
MAIKTPEYLLKPEFMKNHLLNGDMALAQRGTSFAAAASGQYFLDRFQYTKGGAMVHTLSQDSDVPAGTPLKYSARLNLTTPDTSIAAAEACEVVQKVEGYNFVPLTQSAFTLSFWVKATLTGTYCVAFRNSGQDRSFVTEYTVSASETWEHKTVTVLAPPSTGTWNYTNGIGLTISWVLAAGSSLQTTAGAWQIGNYLSTANQVNGVNTGATNFRITGAMLNLGYSAAPFSLSHGSYQDEVIACMRYYEKSYNTLTYAASGDEASATQFLIASGAMRWNFDFKVRKRTAPSVFIYAGDSGTLNAIRNRSTAADTAVGFGDGPGERGYILSMAITANHHYAWNFVADCEL